MKKPRQLRSLAPNERNPRRLSVPARAALKKSLLTFGDLSGFVFNLRTQRLVSGHQRQTIFADSPITITHRFPAATAQGTVAHGYIEHAGERHTYREVDWPLATETAALIAANRHGGEFTREALDSLLNELETSGTDLDLTGFFGDALADARKQAYDSLSKLSALVESEKAAANAAPAPSDPAEKSPAPASSPAPIPARHATLLAFPLTSAELGRWAEVKKQLSIRGDKAAFLALLTSRLDPD